MTVNDPELDPRNYAADDLLRDGATIHTRAIRSSDRELLLEHFNALSDEARYTRFFGAKRSMSQDELTRLTDLDFDNAVGLCATLIVEGRERFIGVGRYFRSSDRVRAEVAFAVLDAYQGRGIATLLLEHLRRIAHPAGIAEFIAEVMGGNQHMLDVFRDSGLTEQTANRSGIVHVTMATNRPVTLSR